MLTNNPCRLGDQNSAVCPCACHKRLMMKRYKLPYTTGFVVCLGFLHAVRRMSLDSWVLCCPDLANILFQRQMSSFFKEPTASLRGDSELEPQS